MGPFVFRPRRLQLPGMGVLLGLFLLLIVWALSLGDGVAALVCVWKWIGLASHTVIFWEQH